MTETREKICRSFAEQIPKLDETKKALLLAYGEGMDAGMSIGMKLAAEKAAERAAEQASETAGA